MRRFLSIAVACTAMLSACTLLTPLDGLAGDDVKAGGVDSGGPADGNVASDGRGATETGPDGSPDGGDSGSSSCSLVSRIQAVHANTQTTSSNTIAVTMTSAQNAGDFVVVGVNYGSCGGVHAVTDRTGNSYQRFIAADFMTGAGSLETWAATNIVTSAAGANAVTVTFGNVCLNKNVKVIEYAGISATTPVGATVSMHGAGGTPVANMLTPAHQLLVAHTADSASATAPGSGWSLIFKDEWATMAEDQIAHEAGTYNATYLPSSGDGWVIQAMALRCR